MDWERRAFERAVSLRLVSEADVERLRGAGLSDRDRLRRLLDENLLSAADFMEVLQEVQGVPRQVAQVELDPTVRDASPASAPSVGAAADLAGEELGDYLLQEEIGRGGVGRVLSAYDRRLKRPVAVKLLDRPDDVASVRFLREAQNQARIEHPNVCKVYDAGEIGGRLYIAMQRIEGDRLDRALAESSVEEKARVLRDVALGVHAAHRQGLVHRDLKPSNVMVERLRDGKLHPYVTDFGVAREIGTSGLTQTGAVIGTPAFMAPEQVQGKHDQLDRRTDVYGLGATLYHLLSGAPPFDNESAVSVLTRVLDEEPDPLRTRVPSLSRDLESIVGKCLEKEPWRRYESARALADDLDRFLDGHPVEARRTGWFGRLQRRARRRPASYAAGALGLLALLGLSVTVVALQVRAQSQRALAQTLGRQVERIDWVSRAERLAPLHDLTPGRQRLRREIEVLDASTGRSRWQRAAVDSAVGRGLLSLGDAPEALARLERAWDAGERGGEVALAKATAHLAAYELLERAARNLQEEADEQLRLEEIESAHLLPAKELVAEGASVDESRAAVLSARIAIEENRDEDAKNWAEAAGNASPWFYERYLLEGDLLLERGKRLLRKGEYQESVVTFAEAGTSYSRAAEIGRSDPTPHQRLCDVAQLQIDALLSLDQAIAEPLERDALTHCDTALSADPANVFALLTKADLHYALSERSLHEGRDPLSHVLETKRLVARVLELDPDLHDARYLMANADNHMIQYSYEAGQDPLPWFESSDQHLSELLRVAPRHVPGLLARGRSLMTWGRSLSGREALAVRAKAVEVLERAAELRPEDARPFFELGSASLIYGNGLVELGSDPRAAFERALEAYATSLEINPNQIWIHGNSALADLQLARWAWTHGEDPLRHTAAARSKLAEVSGAGEVHPIDRFNLGESYREEALFRHLQGLDPTPQTALSREAYRLGLQDWDHMVAAHVDVARSWRVDAEYLVEQGKDPAEAVEQALRGVRAALRLDGNKDSALVERALARGALASARGGAAGRDLARAALVDVERACASEPTDIANWFALATLVLRTEELFASPSERDSLLDRGLAAAEEALALDAGHSQALATRGALRVLAGRADQGKEDLAAALALNRFLETRFEPWLERAD